jgi:two-component system CheB/CheR fusion protein
VREKTENSSDKAAKLTFPIVAIGASAGGLEALRQLFSRLPDDTGMAFVVVQHLDPARPSMLSRVLAADVQMPVVEVAAGMHAKCYPASWMT